MKGKEYSQKLPRFYRNLAVAFVAACLIYILVLSMTMNNGTNVSAVEANGVGVYWDSNCSDKVSLIDWGALKPGSTKSIVVYIRNEVEEPIYFILWTTNWNPSEASQYLNLGWGYSGQRMNPNEILQITLILSVHRYIKGISSFSFDIIITGSDILPGDIDGDGRVFTKDLGLFAKAWGSKVGEPRYDPRCDFNNDGQVFTGDLGIFAKYWGYSL